MLKPTKTITCSNYSYVNYLIKKYMQGSVY